MAPQLELPHGYRNARCALLIVAFLGELLQGESVTAPPTFLVLRTGVSRAVTTCNPCRGAHLRLERVSTHSETPWQLCDWLHASHRRRVAAPPLTSFWLKEGALEMSLVTPV